MPIASTQPPASVANSTVQQRAMTKDFSWKVAAAGYERLYVEAL